MNGMNKPADQILVIFGASGDLTARKLIPAVFELYKRSFLPEHFAILGVGRTEYDDQSFRDKLADKLQHKQYEPRELNDFLDRVHYLSINTDNAEDYATLKARLSEMDGRLQTGGNYIFYLSTPPALYPLIPRFLALQGLNSEENGFRRLVVEKPFGEDLGSAIELNKSLLRDFEETQIYRIDHYLGKETVQNLLVTRFANSIYEPLWNRNYIQHIEVTAAESIGVENRGGYYDQTGALKDMVQNHLLQMLSIVAMEPPTEISSKAIRNEKLKVFQSLRPMKDDDLVRNVIRGQYLAANVRGVHHKGYREEKGVDPDSRTETYVAIKAYVDNWRWAGVPFYIRTGKCLPTRVSEIVITFRPTPNQLFVENKDFHAQNQLVLRIHPDEGVLLKTGMKVPGAGYQVRGVNIEFHYNSLENVYLPEAYERLLLDCMNGDPTLYTRGDALEGAWEFVQPILDYWKNNPDAPLYGYPCGSWGPAGADDLIEGEQLTWRYPCKNLSDDGIFCEL